MDDIVEITGDWIGFYTYDIGHSEQDTDQKVPFRMTVQRGINEFVGRVYEESDYGGIDDEIVIRGRQNGNEIEFTKYYTLEHFTDEQGAIVSVASENPTIVHYQGKFGADENKFSGEWEISYLREDDEGVFHEDNQRGTWEIWRER